MATPPGLDEAFGHCADLVRQVDPDRAVALEFVPADRRTPLAALCAFDIETRSVRERVRQPIAGEIRLQWWRDTLTKGEGEGEGAPVAAALLATIREAGLPVDAFDGLLEARIFDLYDDPMGPRSDFEGYAGATDSAILMLSAMILDRSRAPQVSDAAGHAGVALCVDRCLRDITLHRRRGQIYVPADILEATGTSPAEWISDTGHAAASEEAFAAFGLEHATRVLKSWARISPAVRPAFLPLREAAIRMEGKGGTAKPSRLSSLSRGIRYWRAMRQGFDG